MDGMTMSSRSGAPRAIRLTPRRVAKPWGRRDLGGWFPDAAAGDEPVGEVWFEDPAGSGDLLVKLLFTAARLSVQVHPDDDSAVRAGLPRGKDEAWVILGAEPPAEIAVGLLGDADPATLRAAALDGSIVDRLDWRHVAVGEAFYSAAGTVHAIGAGLTLLEVQQNVDVTYRLFDYGSDRPLDLDAALDVARAGAAGASQRRLDDERTLVASGPKLQIERFRPVRRAFSVDPAATGRLWVFAAAGSGEIDGVALTPGNCVAVAAACAATAAEGVDWFVAYAGGAPAAWLGA